MQLLHRVTHRQMHDDKPRAMTQNFESCVIHLLSMDSDKILEVELSENDSTNIAVFGVAVICSIVGSITYPVTMYVILKEPRVRNHLTSPLLFYQSVNDFLFCSIILPIKAKDYYFGGNGDIPVGWRCKIWPVFAFPNWCLYHWCLCLISMNRLLTIWNLDLAVRPE